MNKNNEDIKKILAKLETIQDQELKELILKLIGEREYLVDAIKIDTLTKVYNRRILEDIKNFSSVVLCDIDSFKQINDNFGHDAGDYVLKSVAEILKHNSRSNDFVCRYGGDEFLIVFNDCPEQIVLNRMNIIKQTITDKIKLPNFITTISIGISNYQEGKTLQEVLTEADEALYQSKAKGKNYITCYQVKELKKEKAK